MQRLWNLPLEESEEENTNDNNQPSSESSDEEIIASDESSEDSGEELSEGENILANDANIDEDQEWKKLPVGSSNLFVRGRTNAENVFKEAVGTRPATMRKIKSELDSFSLFMDENIMKTVFDCTQQHANQSSGLPHFTIDMLQKFIALESARGV